MRMIGIPNFSWYERYKRILEIAYSAIMESHIQTWSDYNSKKAALRIASFHKSVCRDCGKKLVESCNLQPTVQDALRLLFLYSCEVWGYGSHEYNDLHLEHEDKGRFTNLKCRGWELAMRKGMEESLKKIDCSNACISEYAELLGVLADDFAITLNRGLPRGDDRCEFVIEKLEGTEKNRLLDRLMHGVS